MHPRLLIHKTLLVRRLKEIYRHFIIIPVFMYSLIFVCANYELKKYIYTQIRKTLEHLFEKIP